MLLGRVVRPGIDPGWLPTDAALALAWQRHKAEACPHCGTRRDEWEQDRDTAYIPDVHHCRGCQVLAEAKAEVPVDDKGAPLPGFHPYLVPRRLYEAQHPDHDG